MNKTTVYVALCLAFAATAASGQVTPTSSNRRVSAPSTPIGDVKPGAWIIDGKRIDPGKPYDPDAPPYVPKSE